MLCKCSGKYIDIYFNLKITYLLTQQQQNSLVQNSPCRVRQMPPKRTPDPPRSILLSSSSSSSSQRVWGSQSNLPSLVPEAEAQWLNSQLGKPAQSSSSCADLNQLAERLLPSWVHWSSFKWASKASDRATETPGAWCGSCGR